MTRLVALSIAALALGCTSVEGSFAASGEPLGDWEFIPERCASGERSGFFGVALRSGEHEDQQVRLFREPAGADRVQIVIPGTCDATTCEAIELGPESGCELFDTRIERSNSSTNGIWHMHGHLALDCDFATGGSFRGEAEFSNCH